MLNDKIEKKDMPIFNKNNSEAYYLNNNLDNNEKDYDDKKQNYPFPMAPIDSTNRVDKSKFNPLNQMGVSNGLKEYSNNKYQDEEDKDDFHENLRINDKQSNCSNSRRSERSYRTEQSTEIFMNKTITSEDIAKGPHLIIREIEGNQLGDENEIKINPAGMLKGERKSHDGVTLFGPSLTDQYGKCINDFVIASNLKEIGNHLCVIYYKKEQQKYFIRTYKDQLSNGLSVLLIKIKDPYPIKRTELFMIGDLFFAIMNEQSQLKITKLSCKRSPEETEKSFSVNQSPITIGRDNSCDLSFPIDKAFSKIHSTFYYDEEMELWYIKDGIDNKASTNGIWVIPKHSVEIFDKMTFKIMGVSKFLINITSK